MKNAAYVSFIFSIALLVISFVGSLIEMDNVELFLYGGLGMLVLISLPLFLLEKRAYNKTKREILKEFKNNEKHDHSPETKKNKKLNYPSFRKQKSGLTWGGGNIHASSAKREAPKKALCKINRSISQALGDEALSSDDLTTEGVGSEGGSHLKVYSSEGLTSEGFTSEPPKESYKGFSAFLKLRVFI